MYWALLCEFAAARFRLSNGRAPMSTSKNTSLRGYFSFRYLEFAVCLCVRCVTVHGLFVWFVNVHVTLNPFSPVIELRSFKNFLPKKLWKDSRCFPFYPASDVTLGKTTGTQYYPKREIPQTRNSLSIQSCFASVCGALLFISCLILSRML